MQKITTNQPVSKLRTCCGGKSTFYQCHILENSNIKSDPAREIDRARTGSEEAYGHIAYRPVGGRPHQDLRICTFRADIRRHSSLQKKNKIKTTTANEWLVMTSFNKLTFFPPQFHEIVWTASFYRSRFVCTKIIKRCSSQTFNQQQIIAIIIKPGQQSDPVWCCWILLQLCCELEKRECWRTTHVTEVMKCAVPEVQYIRSLGEDC